MMENNKGFAISGILYAILILFLMLLLLILANFQSRKVLFDKQKANVYEKLNSLEVVADFTNSTELNEFITPKDGIYLLEVWGADSSSGTGEYVKGKIALYQGIKLFITIGVNGNPSIIRTEKINENTVILRAKGASNGSSYGFTTANNSDIALEPLISLSYRTLTSNIPAKKIDNKNGYVKISYVSGL